MKPSIVIAAGLGIAAVGLAVLLARQRETNGQLAMELGRVRAELEQTKALAVANEKKAAAPARTEPNAEQLRELMKLRGEVGTLRRTADEAKADAAAKENPPSVMSGLARNPEMVKMIRDQQKMGLGMIYKGLAERAKFSPETTERLNELLADQVMTNINHLTEVLAAGKTAGEMDRVFTAAEAETERQVKELLGEEGFKEYKDYTLNLASYLSAEQFKGMMLKGDKETKEAQGKQLFQLMQEETARSLAAAGLPKDFQTTPTLNFRNIASEEYGEKSLQLLDGIYENVAGRAGTFLSAEELEKFAEFRKMAINNNRLALTMNRKMMAPPNR